MRFYIWLFSQREAGNGDKMLSELYSDLVRDGQSVTKDGTDIVIGDLYIDEEATVNDILEVVML